MPPIVPGPSGPAGGLVQAEADLQGDLEKEAAVVLDPPARVGDLEPVQVVQGPGGARDGAPDRVVDALRGRADDLADRVDVVCHRVIPSLGTFRLDAYPQARLLTPSGWRPSFPR